MKILKTLVAVSLLATAAISQASLFSFDTNPATGGSLGSQIDTVSSTFNSTTQNFTWDVGFASDPTPIDGFWLVVNNGDNPKSSNVNELAIIYGDLQTGIASTYVYNGQNNANSINSPGILLQTDTFAVTSNSFSLDIDATTINAWSGANSANYTGISYDAGVGVWFHVASGSNFGYTNGDITSFSFGQQGWWDAANLVTDELSLNSVSAPSSLAMLGFSLFGLVLLRRKFS
ncbi:PEP-CTERM sorting domain-containing protein [Glaciecola sp. SC05]|uniref:PEP-CTERM sorting domain-containing protein n=1 Tax=Glaciecola sp. SC05 TaxID=1987355 RepID=UPI0035298CF5